MPKAKNADPDPELEQQDIPLSWLIRVCQDLVADPAIADQLAARGLTTSLVVQAEAEYTILIDYTAQLYKQAVKLGGHFNQRVAQHRANRRSYMDYAQPKQETLEVEPLPPVDARYRLDPSPKRETPTVEPLPPVDARPWPSPKRETPTVEPLPPVDVRYRLDPSPKRETPKVEPIPPRDSRASTTSTQKQEPPEDDSND